MADKPDSQDICFVPAGNYAAVIEKLRPGAAEPGDIVGPGGQVLGRHEGVIHYTIGQRRGLGIGGLTEPLYVVRLDVDKRQVIVGPREMLATRRVPVREVNWLGDGPFAEGPAHRACPRPIHPPPDRGSDPSTVRERRRGRACGGRGWRLARAGLCLLRAGGQPGAGRRLDLARRLRTRGVRWVLTHPTAAVPAGTPWSGGAQALGWAIQQGEDWQMPKGYWIASNVVRDAEAYARYKAANAEPFARYGARFLVRGGAQEAREGDPYPRTVVIEFPTIEAARACYDDPAYRAAYDIRKDAAEGQLVIVEGYEPG